MNQKSDEREPGNTQQRAGAESRLAHAPVAKQQPLPVDKLLHELQVRQIELEMQNEELRQSQTALADSRDRYLDFYEFAPVGYFTLTGDGLIAEVNLTGASLLGLEQSKLCGRRFTQFVSREDSERWQLYFLDTLQHIGNPECELKLLRANGVIFYARLERLNLRAEYKPARILIALSDITRQLQKENELGEWRQFVEHASWGMSIGDVETRRIRQANPAYAAMHGYTVTELYGIKADSLYTPESRAALQPIAGALSKTGHLVFECQRLRKDGSTFPASVEITYINDPDGKTVFISNVRDLTEIKQAKRKARISETMYRRLYESMLDAFVIADMSGRLQEFNQAYQEMLGYSAEELHALTYVDLTPKKWHAMEAQIVEEQVIPHGQSQVYEKEYIRKDGAVFPVELRTFLLRDKHGQPEAMWAIVRDITERKRAYEALREQSAFLDSLLESIPIPVFYKDRQGRYLGCNRAQEELLGKSRAEIVGKSVFDMAPPEIAEKYHVMDEALFQQPGTQIYEWVVKKPSGERRDVVFHKATFLRHDGSVGGLIGTILDITESKQAERRLLKSSKLIEDLYNQAPCGYHSLDKDGVIRQINDTELAWLGYARDEIVGKWRLADLLTPGSRLVFKQTFPHFMAKGEVHDVELELICKDGAILPVMISASAIYDRNGNYVMSRSTVYNMTERKKMEQERMDYLNRLEESSRRIVAVQENTLRRLSNELHDRTSPNLAAIGINLEVIAMELPQEHSISLAERLEDTLALITDTTASIREICTDMRQPLLDYAGLTAALESYVQQFTRRTGIAVQFDCANRDARYAPDLELLLFRIIQEALTNCAKHAHATSAIVTLSNDGQLIVLTITDNGGGFDPEQLGKAGQIGLGILNMREIAKTVGGRFTIESAPGQGTRIAVEVSTPGNPF